MQKTNKKTTVLMFDLILGSPLKFVQKTLWQNHVQKTGPWPLLFQQVRSYRCSSWVRCQVNGNCSTFALLVCATVEWHRPACPWWSQRTWAMCFWGAGHSAAIADLLLVPARVLQGLRKHRGFRLTSLRTIPFMRNTNRNCSILQRMYCHVKEYI